MSIKVTETDKAMAARLMDALDDKTPPGAAAKQIAYLLAELREAAVACAVVRVEREYAVRLRAKKG